MLAQRVQRGSHSDCESGDVGRQLDDDTREISDAREEQKGKREIGATALGQRSGEKNPA